MVYEMIVVNMKAEQGFVICAKGDRDWESS